MEAEPDNDDVEYEEEALTTKMPRLKAVTPSPTKPVFNDLKPPPKRPIKIRVHQKPKSSSLSSSSSRPIFSSSSSYIQDLADRRKDFVVSSFPQSKNTSNKTSTQNKPSPPVVKDTEAPPVGRGSVSGSRFINSRRHQGIVFRANSTRLLNGYKFAFNPKSNLPSRTPDQTTLNTRNSATSTQSSQNHKTSHSDTSRPTLGRASSSQSTSGTFSSESSQSTSHAATTSHTSKLKPSVSRTGSQQSLHTDTSVPVQSASHRPSQSSASTHNTYTPEQDTDEGAKSKPAVEEPTSGSRRQTAEEETREDERKAASTNGKPVASHTKISRSFAERFPWLASRYPGRFSSASSRQDGRTTWARFSSPAGADGPLLKETPTRVSGATGAAGVSSIQETSEDVRAASSNDSVKKGVEVGSVKPSLTSQHTPSGNKRSPTTSASSASSSRSTLGSHQSSSGHRGSSESTHVATSNNDNSARNKDYVDEGSKDNDSRVIQNNPVITGTDPHRNAEDNESVGENETSARTRSGTSSVVSPSYRQTGSGGNGRIRSSSRQFGASRFSIRPKPAQNSRLDSSTSDSASSSPHSVPVSSERDAGTSAGTSAAKTGAVIGSNPRSTSASSARDRSLGARSQNPFIRGKPTSGRALKPGNGHGNIHVRCDWLNIPAVSFALLMLLFR